MKRFAALLLVAAFVLGSAVAAKADGIDIKVKGQWDFAFGWTGNKNFKKSYMHAEEQGDNDKFISRQRIRTQIDFVTSEYLSAVLMFEIGSTDWGRGNELPARAGGSAGGSLDSDGVNIKTKRAYLDWVIPNTPVSVRMGIQGLTLPSTPMGSPVFDADVAGILVSSPLTDWLSVAAFWIRPFDAYADGDRRDFSDEVDAFGILLPMEFDGVVFTPWFIYGFVGANSGFYDYLFDGNSYDNTVTAENSSAKAYWIGSHLELSLFDPLVLNLEGIYGHISQADLTGFMGAVEKGWGHSTRYGASGWYLGATLDYSLDFMTPGIFGWWASGDKANSDDDGRLGRLPVFGNDGGNFAATSFGCAGYYGIGNWDDWEAVVGTAAGTWGVGIQLADVSFIEDLSHTLRFAYYRGTNDAELVKKGGVFLPYAADALYLTDEDYVMEVNFDHQYQIYENLTAVVELGWLRLHADKDTWKNHSAGNTGDRKENQNAWKAELNFRYSF